MAYPNVFDSTECANTFNRLQQLTASTQPKWGKMNAAQMLAHLNVAYAVTYNNTEVKNNFLMKILLKVIIKKIVVGNAPYKKNSQTAPHFLIADERDFEKEKELFIGNVNTTLQHGVAYFEGKENKSFGKLTGQQWNILFSKHIEHHFQQFGL